jgi:hypothetical protein
VLTSPFAERFLLAGLAQAPLLVHFIIDLNFFTYRDMLALEWAMLACYFLALYLFLWLVLSEPGIIHKVNKNYEHEEDFLRIPVNSKVTENRSCAYSLTARGFQHRIKFCKTCNIYRPPRAVHCDRCGFCIEEHNHHSEWLGTCVGLRNFTRYYVFLVCCCLALLLAMVTSVKIIDFRSDLDGTRGYQQYPYAVVACIYSCLLLLYFIPVTLLQTLLLARNETYQEFYESVWSTDSGNPFARGLWARLGALLEPMPESRFVLNSWIYIRRDRKPQDSCSLISDERSELAEPVESLSAVRPQAYLQKEESEPSQHGALDIMDMMDQMDQLDRISQEGHRPEALARGK